ncbi:MAG: AraC family transcriptional regulator [marine bacterium B5-7]|nr:MAG: AraC family transcriptional regulator [marine bacterium B5-7]
MPDRRNDDVAFDVLGDVLETLRFRGTIFFRSELAAPWGIFLDPVGLPRFHIALSGSCYVGGDDFDDLEVREMGIVMLPVDNSHWIADQPGRELVASARAGEACELNNPLFQQGKITNRIMCGIVHYDQDSPHPLLDSLPKILSFPEFEPTEPIWITVTLIDAQMRSVNDRTRSIVDRLTEVLFLQLLNCYVERNQDATGFLAALRDRRVQHALMLIHREPAFDWSLSLLGERVGMSRATLVRHFKDTVGVAPMTYILNWRLAKAYNLVKHTCMPLEQIADNVGFASSRSLSKAFRRCYQLTPKELRNRLPDNQN